MDKSELDYYEIKVTFDPRENEYLAVISEIPSISGYGDSPSQAIDNVREALLACWEVSEEDGIPMAPPAKELIHQR